jgi:hypothetical protein
MYYAILQHNVHMYVCANSVSINLSLTICYCGCSYLHVFWSCEVNNGVGPGPSPHDRLVLAQFVQRHAALPCEQA